jgi:predicted nucleic acid-binding protein
VAKVYLETSFFSACVNTRAGAKALGWKASSNEWWQTQAKHHDLYISTEVLRELSHPAFLNRLQALSMTRGLESLEMTHEVEVFSELLVRESVMPQPDTGGDALHVAFAAVYKMDYILTWNVKHLANPNKLHISP